MILRLGLNILRFSGTFIKDILWDNLELENGYNMLQEDGYYLLWEA